MFRWIRGLWDRLSRSNLQPEVVEDALDPELPADPTPDPDPTSKATSESRPEEYRVDGCSVVEREGKVVMYKCGHYENELFKLELYGEIFPLKDEVIGLRNRCGECLMKDAIPYILRCARCGRSIMPNMRTVLCPSSHVPSNKWNATISKNGEEIGAVCCLRRNCCLPGAYLTGIWHGTKFTLIDGYLKIAPEMAKGLSRFPN